MIAVLVTIAACGLLAGAFVRFVARRALLRGYRRGITESTSRWLALYRKLDEQWTAVTRRAREGHIACEEALLAKLESERAQSARLRKFIDENIIVVETTTGAAKGN